MIYQYDDTIDMPTMDVYDSGMLNSYINAMKNDYEQGLKQYEDFKSEYGDFTSPIQKSVQWWDENVNQPVRNFVTQAAANGIDFRSPEFRAALARLEANLPYTQMRSMKQQAAIATEYLKNRGDLARAGKYDPLYEKYLLGGKSLETWDPIADGPWTRTSPDQLNTLTDFSKAATAGMKDEFIQNDGKYNWFGITNDRASKAIGGQMMDYLNTTSGQYYLNKVADQNGLNLQDPASYDKAVNLLLQTAIDRSGVVGMIPKEDPYAMEQQQLNNSIALENVRHANDVDLEGIKFQNQLRRYTLTGSSTGNGGSGSGKSKDLNIFNQADYSGQATFNTNNAVKNGIIAPKGVLYNTQSVSRRNSDKGISVNYTSSSYQINNIKTANLYTSSFSKYNKINKYSKESLSFDPNGKLIKRGNGYFVEGRIRATGPNGTRYVKDKDGNDISYMRVGRQDVKNR